jgi:hypothetical protein
LGLLGFSASDEHAQEYAIKFWRFCLDGVDEGDYKQDTSALLFKYGFGSHKDLVPYTANNIVDRLSPT